MNIDAVNAALRAAIEATSQEDWSPTGDEPVPGYRFYSASSQGWRFTVGFGGPHQDGTAVKATAIVHLPPELSILARQKAEGQ